jgi:hypothetical protein
MIGVGASVVSATADLEALPAGSLMAGGELVIPPWAHSLVTSQLMVLGFVVDALTDSGKAIMFPAALLVVGMALVLIESTWMRRMTSRAER